MRIFTNLNLNGTTPLRVQPGVGEWGPSSVQPTRRKRLTRWMWIAAFVVVLTVMFILGYIAYGMIMSAGT